MSGSVDNGDGSGGGGFLVFIYCWSYWMCFTCGKCAVYTYTNGRAERPEQWKLIESINENMNNEGGSFTFRGLYLEWRVHTLRALVYVRVSASTSKCCCACLYVWMLENSTIVHQRSNVIYSRTTCIYCVRLCMCMCVLFGFLFIFFIFFWGFYTLFIFLPLNFFPIHIVAAIIFRKSEA